MVEDHDYVAYSTLGFSVRRSLLDFVFFFFFQAEDGIRDLTVTGDVCSSDLIGPKTAQRLTFFLLKRPVEEVRELSESLLAVKDRIVSCRTCFNVTDEDPCRICADPTRDAQLLCVVEEPNDLLAMERTGEYRGRYHVLLGALSPLDGIGPDDLKVKELLVRLEGGATTEGIPAANTQVDGEATALYLAQLVRPLGIPVTRIARGLPVGGDLEYAHQGTLPKAPEGRGGMGGKK